MTTTLKAPRRSPATDHSKPGRNGKLDRASVVREIDAKMRVIYPSDGVDRLATRPFDFARMALAVARSQKLLSEPYVVAVEKLLDTWIVDCSDAVCAIDLICRIAMNARKQGKLHPHAPSPAMKAADTRKRQKGAQR